MLKNWKVYVVILAIILVAIILFLIFKPAEFAPPPGDLRGTWRLHGDFLQSGASTRLLLQINEFGVVAGQPDTYLGVGCMQTGATESWAPLSLQAVLDGGSGSYALTMLSTLVAAELDEGAAVIRFVGEAEMGSAGSKDDRLSGTAYTVAGESEWLGEHSSLKTVECPAWDEGLVFLGEFAIYRDLAHIPAWDIINFSGETLIASAKMRVEAPDGQVYLADYHTDIFTPDVNFIDQFRFHYPIEGTPITGEPYRFTLLDVLGEAIPGVAAQDTYNRCDQGSATNLRAVVHLRADNTQVDYVELSWDAPQTIPDYFDPQNGHGFYQLALRRSAGQEGIAFYGAETTATTHNIPWESFEPGSAASPDGYDYGISLAELEDGEYILSILVYSYYEPQVGESGFDCSVTDSRHAMFITRQGDQITVQPAGAMTGFAYDSAGDPLAGVAVEINGLGSGFHERVCSRANGYYLFTRLPLDTFTLSAGGFGAEECPPNSFATITQPDVVLDADNPIREGLDIVLAP
jgi:hypothetical protein